MKNMLWFIIGWFISLFATHYFGWELTLKTGLILLGIWIFFTIILYPDKTDIKAKIRTSKQRRKQ